MSLFLITCKDLESFSGNIPRVRDLITDRGRRVRVDSSGRIHAFVRCGSGTEPAAIIDSRVADLVPDFREYLKDVGRLLFYSDIMELNGRTA
jgi:hypothetical protein